MKIIFRALLVVLILAASFISYASLEVTWSVTPPTEYTNGTPIEEGAITEHILYCNDNSAVIMIAPIVDSTLTLSPGVYECYATTVAHGRESEPSNIVTKIVEWPKPKPPVLSQN